MRKAPFQLLVLLSLLTLIACSSGGKTASSLPSATPTQVHQPTSTTPSTLSVDCPAPGTARAAVLPSFSAGSDQNVVYILNTGSAAALQRYDVTTNVTTQIISLAQTNISAAEHVSDAAGASPDGGGNQTSISDAALSPDGHWILFVELTATQTKLQLVRLDGQDLQTLYCLSFASNGANPLRNIQWSPNQQLVAFDGNLGGSSSYISAGGPGGATNQVNLLNLSSGTIQTLFANEFDYPAAGWLDNTRLYLRGPTVDGPSPALYLLDLNRGLNQNQNDLLTVFQASATNPCWDAASSADRTQVFVSQCTYTNTGNTPGPGWDTQEGPGNLSVVSSTGGSLQSLYTNTTLGLVSVRAVTPTTLLVLVNNYSANGSADTSQNGLWTLSTTGSGFIRLVTQGANQQDRLNSFAQDPWANGSRDGQFYALTINDMGTNSTSLTFGKLSGGTPKSFATAPTGGNVPSLALVGWTTD
jgi:hypothetical protein